MSVKKCLGYRGKTCSHFAQSPRGPGASPFFLLCVYMGGRGGGQVDIENIGDMGETTLVVHTVCVLGVLGVEGPVGYGGYRGDL